jgi:hypothetical protein
VDDSPSSPPADGQQAFTILAVINRRGRRLGHNPLFHRPIVPSQVEPTIIEEAFEAPAILPLTEEVVEQEIVEPTQPKRGRKKMTDVEKLEAKQLRDAAKIKLLTQSTQAISSAQPTKRKRANVISSDED